MLVTRLIKSWPTLENNLKFSVTALILSNLLPLLGVMFFSWSVFNVMILFWFENVIIGFYNVLKMAIASGINLPTSSGSRASILFSKLFFIPFFIVHYGIFTTVHGGFIFFLFSADSGVFRSGVPAAPSTLGSMVDTVLQTLFIPALGLFISHGVSFCFNFVRGGEWKKVGHQELMVNVYGRVIILHVVILFGAIGAQVLGSKVVPLVLLIVLKTWVDLWAHLREHSDKSNSQATAASAY